MMVTVGRQEWFVFRRYAEFDKLYNIVSFLFWLFSGLCFMMFRVTFRVITNTSQ